MKAQIKILAATPFDKADTVLSVEDFRLKYSYVCAKTVSDGALVQYLKKGRQLWLEAGDNKDSINAGYWFDVIEEPTYSFGDGEVSIQRTPTGKVIIDCESKGARFSFEEVRDWYNHFLHVMMGFSSFDNSSAKFEGLIIKRHMFPEEFHLKTTGQDTRVLRTNHAERAQLIDDNVSLPMLVDRLDLIKIKVGCLVGTVEELIVILSECKKLQDETKG